MTRGHTRRSPITRGLSLGLCGLVVALPAIVMAPHDAAAAASSTRLSIDEFSPKAAGPKSVIHVSGHLLNSSGAVLPHATVRLRYSPRPLPSRSQLKLYAAKAVGSADPRSVAVQRTLPHGVDAKSSAAWSLKVPVSHLGVPNTLGVYPIAVDAVDGAGRTIAEQRTFLTYGTKSAAYKPTRIAWLWPIIDRPRRADDGTFMENTLGTSLASGGRLARLVEAGVRNKQKVPLTWMVDPALLDDADHLSRAHRTLSIGTKTKAQPGDPNAAAWLGRLRTAIGGAPLVSLPYGDVDATAITRAGLDDDVKPAVQSGARITQQLLKRAPSTNVAWPAQGLADADTMDVLAFAGAGSVVLSQRALSASSQLSYTPDGATKLPTSNGDVKVLLTDPTLGDVLADPPEQASAAITEQRFLAETALITTELPNSPRTVVVAPPRRWDPAAGLPEALLNDTRGVPWMKPVPATSVKPSGGLDRRLRYGASAKQDELGRRYLHRVAEIRSQAKRFGGLFPGGADPYELATFRMESAAWRDSPTRARRARERVRWSVDQSSGKINFVNRASVTMGGSEAKIPVTIANELDAGATAESRAAHTATVRVRVTAPDSNSISIGKYDQVKKIGPGSKVTVYVPVTARAVAVTRLRLELQAADGKPINPPVSMKVQVTNIGETASWVTGAALGVLVIAAAVRFLRRRSRGDGDTPPDDADASTTRADPGPGSGDDDRGVPDAVKVASSADVFPADRDDDGTPDDPGPSAPGEPGMSSGSVREHRRP